MGESQSVDCVVTAVTFDAAASLRHRMHMSEIEIAPLSETLDDDELKTLQKLLEQAGAKLSGHEDQTRHKIATRLDEDAMTEFMDRLEAHDLAADIYVPAEFEGRLTVGEYRVASAQMLVDVLEEMKDELDVEDEKEETEDEEEEYEDDEEDDAEEEDSTVIEAQLRHIWQLVSTGCTEALEKSVPLHLRV
jgi:hypothetical protein